MTLINIWCIIISVIILFIALWYFYKNDSLIQAVCLNYYYQCRTMDKKVLRIEYIMLTTNHKLWSISKFSLPAGLGFLWSQYKIEVNAIVGRLFARESTVAVDITALVSVVAIVCFLLVLYNYRIEEMKIMILTDILATSNNNPDILNKNE